MVRQQRAQPVTTTTPAGVHITTQVFAVAGTNERRILTQIKDSDCDPVVGIMSRAYSDQGAAYSQLRPPEMVAFFLALALTRLVQPSA